MASEFRVVRCTCDWIRFKELIVSTIHLWGPTRRIKEVRWFKAHSRFTPTTTNPTKGKQIQEHMFITFLALATYMICAGWIRFQLQGALENSLTPNQPLLGRRVSDHVSEVLRYTTYPTKASPVSPHGQPRAQRLTDHLSFLSLLDHLFSM